MNRMIIATLLLLVFNSCAENKKIITSGNSIQFGTESTLDVITWNIENFPKQNGSTVNYLAELIPLLDVDIIAMQEIGDDDYFNQLVGQLNGWRGFRAGGSWGLAYIYKSEVIINRIEEIQALDNYNLTRTPLLMELEWGGENVYIINNHYKCCGNGTIEIEYDDEEYRRLQSSILTKTYIESNLDSQKVILVGDLNDELNDEESINVFQNFIIDSTNYKFVDMDIAYSSSLNWSYPSWPSHLDHILITNELFDEFENEGSSVQTIRLEEYFDNGWAEYENYISDHRPVGLRLKFSQ